MQHHACETFETRCWGRGNPPPYGEVEALAERVFLAIMSNPEWCDTKNEGRALGAFLAAEAFLVERDRRRRAIKEEEERINA